MRRDAPANDACTVRLATSGDSDLLQTVLDNSSGAANSDIFGLNATELLQAHQVHLALNDGEPIGCVMVTVANSSVIHNLAVVQAFRNQGHATTLIRAAIAYNDKAHAPEIYWTAVDGGTAGAWERFAKLGFEGAGVEDHGTLRLMIRKRPHNDLRTVEAA
ncbi:unannotated protein [freshwater metagenome]|uniref:Unannotated protein n=1 Tax=freshwater metagenome TaxID=449393 RepID=A0A6J7HV09_9ZZZZ|nr:GNAT family N-acetyltransferase [Actinomycetota bacterium]